MVSINALKGYSCTLTNKFLNASNDLFCLHIIGYLSLLSLFLYLFYLTLNPKYKYGVSEQLKVLIYTNCWMFTEAELSHLRVLRSNCQLMRFSSSLISFFLSISLCVVCLALNPHCLAVIPKWFFCHFFHV